MLNLTQVAVIVYLVEENWKEKLRWEKKIIDQITFWTFIVSYIRMHSSHSMDWLLDLHCASQ